MKCETIRNMISSYIDKDLNDIEKIELEKHLTECKQCREEYESMLDILAVCSNLEELELPQGFRTELHQKLVEEKKKRTIFSGFLGNRSMKMASGLVAAVLIVVIGIGGTSLLMNKNAKLAQDSNTRSGYSGAVGAAPEMPMAPPNDTYLDSKAKGSDGTQYDIAAAEQPQAAALENTSEAKNSVVTEFTEGILANRAMPNETEDSSRAGRMVIRTGNISVNVENVDKVVSDIKQLTESIGGYIENSQVDNVTIPQVEYINGVSTTKDITEKNANMSIRVPEAEFQNIFNNIKTMGKLVNENMTGSDITSEYRDTEARVDNLKIQEKSLQQLMTKAQNVDEILRIESELNRVRTDIDINSGNLKHWDNLVQLSTIYIYMRELKPEELKSVDVPGMWDKAYQGFIRAINNVVVGLENLVILLIAAVPYLVIVGILAIIGLYIAKKIKLKKKQ